MAMQSFKTLKCKQNNETFYISVINSKILKKICYVSRKKEDREKGFQRLLNAKRAKDIAKYLDDSKGAIPSAIIVSAQPNTKIRYNEDKSTLTFDIVENGFLVIDGQHRLYGLIESSNDYDFPIIVFTDLTSTKEVNLFIDINTTQKGVPAALILDIKSQAGTETKIEERQRILFDKVNTESVLAGFLLPNESKTGKISRAAFNVSTKCVFSDSIISEETDENIFKVLCNFYEAVDSVFKETGDKEARLSKTILFKSVMEVFNEICEKCFSTYNNFKVDSFKELVDPLKDLNFSSYTGTNKTSQKQVVMEIRSLLRDHLVIKEDMF